VGEEVRRGAIMSQAFFGKDWEVLLEAYARSHLHPVNRFCHSVGIPLIATSAFLILAGFLMHELWFVAAIMFTAGWILQFVGHAFERKLPEFFRDWRFLFVGLRWWFLKIRKAR
jgi:uncharacterized membrane protein YGL010W